MRDPNLRAQNWPPAFQKLNRKWSLVLQKLAPKQAPNFAQKVSLILPTAGPQFGRDWNQNWPPILHRNGPKIGGASKL